MLHINQWVTFELPITVRNPSTQPGVPGTPIDLTGATAEGWIVKGYTSPVRFPLSFEFAADRTTGQLTGRLTEAQTGVIPDGEFICLVRVMDSVQRVILLLDDPILVKPGVNPNA